MPDTQSVSKAFLSHNSEDKKAVEDIKGLLERGDPALNEPQIPCWYDKDVLTSIGPRGVGKTWMEQLELGLKECEAAVIFFGPNGIGPVQGPEKSLLLKRAMYEKGKDGLRLAVVLLPGADENAVKGFCSLWMWADFRSGLDDAAALHRLRAFIQGKAPSSGPDADPLVPKPLIEPYRGLQAFDGQHAGYFFGRDEEIKKLCERLNEWPVTTVIGGSGSGKSSIVRAGLQTEVARKERPVLRDKTTIITVRPGSDPIHELAVKVAQAKPQKTAKELEQEFQQRADGLYRELSELFPSDDQHVLLVIDQFEELFTHSATDERTQKREGEAPAEPRILEPETGEEHGSAASPSRTLASRLAAQTAPAAGSLRSQQEHFVALLAAVKNSERHRLRIVITLRADFLDRCLSIPMLQAMVENRTLLLGQLSPEALREVIERPARVAEASFEKGLIERILKDVENQNGSLPLLQHALTELWGKRRFGFLTDDAYTETGGVEGALKKRADETLKKLSPEQCEIAKNIFLRLTTLGEGVSDTRRRVRKAELYPEKTDRAAVDEVLKALSSDSGRLIVIGKDVTSGKTAITDQDTVEVTHEALIQRWSTLKNWLNENRDDKRLHDQLRDAANYWSSATEEHRASYLWEGGRLDLAEQFEKCFVSVPSVAEKLPPAARSAQVSIPVPPHRAGRSAASSLRMTHLASVFPLRPCAFAPLR